MTMTEQTEVKAPPRKKRRAKRKAAPKVKVAAATKDDELAGLTVKDCCLACNAAECVISGRPYCAHPRKGGLHSEDMSDNAALTRRRNAENRLRDQMLAVR
jgi:hypothetical protein